MLAKITAVECSEEFTELNFKPSTYLDATGRSLPCFNMTKDGFTFLVMGFSGKKAAAGFENIVPAARNGGGGLHRVRRGQPKI